jgi:hypothetical protein
MAPIQGSVSEGQLLVTLLPAANRDEQQDAETCRRSCRRTDHLHRSWHYDPGRGRGLAPILETESMILFASRKASMIDAEASLRYRRRKGQYAVHRGDGSRRDAEASLRHRRRKWCSSESMRYCLVDAFGYERTRSLYQQMQRHGSYSGDGKCVVTEKPVM